jgi:hypothetical protein
MLTEGGVKCALRIVHLWNCSQKHTVTLSIYRDVPEFSAVQRRDFAGNLEDSLFMAPTTYGFKKIKRFQSFYQ